MFILKTQILAKYVLVRVPTLSKKWNSPTSIEICNHHNATAVRFSQTTCKIPRPFRTKSISWLSAGQWKPVHSQQKQKNHGMWCTWIIPTSLAPSPMASVMACVWWRTRSTSSAFCSGDVRQQMTARHDAATFRKSRRQSNVSAKFSVFTNNKTWLTWFNLTAY